MCTLVLPALLISLACASPRGPRSVPSRSRPTDGRSQLAGGDRQATSRARSGAQDQRRKGHRDLRVPPPHDLPLGLSHGGGARSPSGPLKVINVYGWGLCGGQHTVLKALYETAGWECRYVGWPGHTTIEVKYDGKWHYFDVFLKCYYWSKDKSHVASQEEIAERSVDRPGRGQGGPGGPAEPLLRRRCRRTSCRLQEAQRGRRLEGLGVGHLAR